MRNFIYLLIIFVLFGIVGRVEYNAEVAEVQAHAQAQ